MKRSKTLHLSGSYSNIIKARAREVRAASISPTHPSPQRRVEVDDEEGMFKVMVGHAVEPVYNSHQYCLLIFRLG